MIDRMRECESIFRQVLNRELLQMTLSNTRNADRAVKVKVRPVLIQDKLLFQETVYRGTQVFHANYTDVELAEKLDEYMVHLFRQAQISCETEDISILVGKKGTVTVKRKKKNVSRKQNCEADTAGKRDFSHNRRKKYILSEGDPVDFLVGLGVQTPDGRVTKAYYDKFRQINRYLELLDKLPTDRTIRIIDFGCGKSYLTFAMYYYLHQMQGRDIRVTGLDLKADVIAHCNQLAEKLGYHQLDFEVGDIKSYTGEDKVDMVVSLHACDKATDYALEKAVKWGAQVILAVPCCQHELNTQILEFIDMEHTPKNLLIRAEKSGKMRPAGKSASLDEVMEFLKVNPTLKELL